MTKQYLTILFILLLSASAALTQTEPTARAAKNPPLADHHQHIFSPAIAAVQKAQPILAADVIKLLDEAGIKRGVLLSYAYSYSRPGREPKDEYEKVKEENDWVGAQAALFPKRLVAFCGLNPLKDYALGEIARCAKDPNLRRGIKMHFGNSDVQLQNPEHIEKLKAVFRAANANRMAIAVHMRASISLDRPYGPKQARAFIEQLLPLAKNITVQIAHTGASGPGYDDPKAHAFLEGFLDVLRGSGKNPVGLVERDPRTKNLWFDVTSSAHPSNSPELSTLLAKRIREIGVRRILYGTDANIGGNLKPREAWAEVAKLNLTDSEIKTIANNRVPYLR